MARRRDSRRCKSSVGARNQIGWPDVAFECYESVVSKLSGRCLCGAVTFTVRNAETHHHACHCSMCRRWSGGPVMATAVFGLELQGESHVVRYDSSDWAQRGFCGKCGTNLFYFVKPAHQYLVCVGTFDDPAAFELVKEIYIDHKPPGYALGGDLEQKTEADVLAEFGLTGD